METNFPYQVYTNILIYSPYIKYIVDVNQEHYLFISMYYLNSTHNSIFNLVNSVNIKSEQ